MPLSQPKRRRGVAGTSASLFTDSTTLQDALQEGLRLLERVEGSASEVARKAILAWNPKPAHVVNMSDEDGKEAAFDRLADIIFDPKGYDQHILDACVPALARASRSGCALWATQGFTWWGCRSAASLVPLLHSAMLNPHLCPRVCILPQRWPPLVVHHSGLQRGEDDEKITIAFGQKRGADVLDPKAAEAAKAFTSSMSALAATGSGGKKRKVEETSRPVISCCRPPSSL